MPISFSTQLAYRYLQQTKSLPNQGAQYFGEAYLPYLETSQNKQLLGAFGSYHNLDAQGDQIMLNYRRLRNPQQTNCGEVSETPADCMTVSEVLTQDVSALADMKGRIILIGTTAPGADPWRSPFSSSGASTPGVFLQAQMVSQLVAAGLGERSLLSSWREWQEWLWIVSWGLGGGAIGLYFGRTQLWLWLMVGEGLLLLACWLFLVQMAVWVPWVPSAIALPVSALAAHSVRKRSATVLRSG